MDLYYVIKEPLITEKIAQSRTDVNKYFFNVDLSATKDDVKNAVEKIFKVSVTAVRTITMHGKPKRNPKSRSPRPAQKWKKAIVTLKKGNKIELFEGV